VSAPAPAPGGPHAGRRPAYVVEICISPQLRKREPGRPPSLWEALEAGPAEPQGSAASSQAGPSEETGSTTSSHLRGEVRRPGASPADHLHAAGGHEQPAGHHELAHAVRSVACACTAGPGVPCSLSGDHLARYLRAEQRDAISRGTLTRVIAGLDVIAPDVLIRPPGDATTAAEGRTAGRVIRPSARRSPDPAQASARTVPAPATRATPELEAGL
jgi:hypothetical protein